MGNARDWALEIDAEFTRTMGDVRDAVIYIATEALDRVKRKSPVDTGQFINNWLVSVGGPSAETVDLPGSLQGQSMAAIAAYASIEGWPVIYVANNLPYANRLEHGHSSQAPAGMVAITIPELEALAQGIEI